MKKTTFTLPDRIEIVERLKKVDGNLFLAKTFYTTIAQSAAQEFHPEGFVMMILTKIDQYSKYQPVDVASLKMKIPSYIDALVDDKEMAQAAKIFYQELQPVGNK